MGYPYGEFENVDNKFLADNYKYTLSNKSEEISRFANDNKNFEKITDKKKRAATQKYLKNRAAAMKNIEDLEQKKNQVIDQKKYRSKSALKENYGPKGANSRYMLQVHKKANQSTGYGCWSVSMQVLLSSVGVELTQEEIRAFRPAFDEKQMKYIMEKKAVDDEDRKKNPYHQNAGNWYVMTSNEIGNTFDYSDLILRTVPNTGIRSVTYNTVTAGNKKDIVEDILNTVNDAITTTNSAVSILLKGHYVTITGIDRTRNMVYVEDSMGKLDGWQSLDGILSDGATPQLTWLQKLTVEDDGKVSGLPDHYKGISYVKGQLSMPKTGYEAAGSDLQLLSTAIYSNDFTYPEELKNNSVTGRRERYVPPMQLVADPKLLDMQQSTPEHKNPAQGVPVKEAYRESWQDDSDRMVGLLRKDFMEWSSADNTAKAGTIFAEMLKVAHNHKLELSLNATYQEPYKKALSEIMAFYSIIQDIESVPRINTLTDKLSGLIVASKDIVGDPAHFQGFNDWVTMIEHVSEFNKNLLSAAAALKKSHPQKEDDDRYKLYDRHTESSEELYRRADKIVANAGIRMDELLLQEPNEERQEQERTHSFDLRSESDDSEIWGNDEKLNTGSEDKKDNSEQNQEEPKNEQKDNQEESKDNQEEPKDNQEENQEESKDNQEENQEEPKDNQEENQEDNQEEKLAAAAFRNFSARMFDPENSAVYDFPSRQYMKEFRESFAKEFKGEIDKERKDKNLFYNIETYWLAEYEEYMNDVWGPSNDLHEVPSAEELTHMYTLLENACVAAGSVIKNKEKTYTDGQVTLMRNMRENLKHDRNLLARIQKYVKENNQKKNAANAGAYDRKYTIQLMLEAKSSYAYALRKHGDIDSEDMDIIDNSQRKTALSKVEEAKQAFEGLHSEKLKGKVIDLQREIWDKINSFYAEIEILNKESMFYNTDKFNDIRDYLRNLVGKNIDTPNITNSIMKDLEDYIKKYMGAKDGRAAEAKKGKRKTETGQRRYDAVKRMADYLARAKKQMNNYLGEMSGIKVGDVISFRNHAEEEFDRDIIEKIADIKTFYEDLKRTIEAGEYDEEKKDNTRTKALSRFIVLDYMYSNEWNEVLGHMTLNELNRRAERVENGSAMKLMMKVMGTMEESLETSEKILDFPTTSEWKKCFKSCIEYYKEAESLKNMNEAALKNYRDNLTKKTGKTTWFDDFRNLLVDEKIKRADELLKNKQELRRSEFRKTMMRYNPSFAKLRSGARFSDQDFVNGMRAARDERGKDETLIENTRVLKALAACIFLKNHAEMDVRNLFIAGRMSAEMEDAGKQAYKLLEMKKIAGEPDENGKTPLEGIMKMMSDGADMLREKLTEIEKKSDITKPEFMNSPDGELVRRIATTLKSISVEYEGLNDLNANLNIARTLKEWKEKYKKFFESDSYSYETEDILDHDQVRDIDEENDIGGKNETEQKMAAIRNHTAIISTLYRQNEKALQNLSLAGKNEESENNIIFALAGAGCTRAFVKASVKDGFKKNDADEKMARAEVCNNAYKSKNISKKLSEKTIAWCKEIAESQEKITELAPLIADGTVAEIFKVEDVEYRDSFGQEKRSATADYRIKVKYDSAAEVMKWAKDKKKERRKEANETLKEMIKKSEEMKNTYAAKYFARGIDAMEFLRDMYAAPEIVLTGDRQEEMEQVSCSILKAAFMSEAVKAGKAENAARKEWNRVYNSSSMQFSLKNSAVSVVGMLRSKDGAKKLLKEPQREAKIAQRAEEMKADTKKTVVNVLG